MPCSSASRKQLLHVHIQTQAMGALASQRIHMQATANLLGRRSTLVPVRRQVCQHLELTRSWMDERT